MSSEGDTDGLTAYLLNGLRNLAAAGAEVGALACNTGHMVFNELQKASPIPLLDTMQIHILALIDAVIPFNTV